MPMLNSKPKQALAPNPKLNEIFVNIYNFKFDRADSLARTFPFQSTTERMAVKMFTLWWRGLTYPYPNKYLDSLDRLCLNIIGMRGSPPNPSVYDPFTVAVAGAFSIRISSIRRDNMFALRVFLKIRPTLLQIIYNPGNSPELMLVSGVYNMAAAGIKKNQPLLRPFFVFLPPSSEANGREMLLRCTRSNYVPIATEGYYFLYRIYEEINYNWREAKPYSLWLTEKYPENPIFAVNHILLLRELGFDTTVQSKHLRAKVSATSLSPTQKFHVLEELDIGKRK